MSLEVNKIEDCLHHSLIIVTFFTIKKHLLFVRSNNLNLTTHLYTSHLLIHPQIHLPCIHPSIHSPINSIIHPSPTQTSPIPLNIPPTHSTSSHPLTIHPFPHPFTYLPTHLPTLSYSNLSTQSYTNHPPHPLTHPKNKYESNTHFAPLA